MEGGGSSESSSGSDRSTGARTKTPALPASTRMQRNQAEKQRRDRLNGYISELATLVPMVSNASKPLDKVSILRLAAAQMRLNISCLNPKKFKCKPVTLPSTVISYLDVIEKTVGGFILVTTFSGCIVFCSKSIEDYVGYQNIDVMGNSVFNYIHSGDVTYFEKKVNSVINQKRSSKKQTKVIKVHMQQRPLPRSNDVRYRKMIFKLSVHLNETSEGGSNGQTQTTSKVKKTGRMKDFGASAVVLMFIEPVRLEPEIDISYIESHQDAYFTMHGLKGEIIYADQRISSITGYMPHDVQGTSAYQYICSSDVPVALFAQKAMFTSNDGTGVIVYRLRIRDMRYIYLQSSGQIAYKDSSSEISHFVCFNKLLSDEEGSQELKRFQQRFAPQIMAAKMHQGKKNDVNGHPQTPDIVLEHALKMINLPLPGTLDLPGTSNLLEIPDSPGTPTLPGSSAIPGTSLLPGTSSLPVAPALPEALALPRAQTLPGTSTLPGGSTLLGTMIEEATSRVPRDPLSGSPLGIADKNTNECFLSPAGSAAASSSIHSSEGHSLTSPVSDTGSTSNVSGYNGSWTYESSGERISEQSDFALQEQDRRSLLSSDYSSYTVNSYDSLNVVPIEGRIGQEVRSNGIEDLHMPNELHSEDSIDLSGCFPNHHNILYNGSKLQSEEMHSVNAYSILPNGNNTIGISEQVANDHPENFVFDSTGHQNTPFNLGSMLNVPDPATSINNDITLNMNGQVNGYTSHNGHDPYIQVSESHHFDNTQSGLHLTPANSVYDREMCFETEHLNDMTSFSGGYEISNSSLPKISNRRSIDSGLGETMDFSSSKISYRENSSCSNNYISRNVEYNDCGIGEFYDLDVKPEKYSGNHSESNNYLPDLTIGFPPSSSFNNICNPVKQPVNESHANGDVPLFLSNGNIKPSINSSQNGISEASGNDSGHSVTSMDWNSARIRLDTAENVEPNLNKELYRELDLFFQNLSPNPQDVCVSETNSGLSFTNNSQSQKSISSRAKTRYRQ